MARIFPIIWFIFIAGVMYNIWQSPYHSRDEKFLWMGVVFFFPVIGILMWLLYGMRK